VYWAESGKKFGIQTAWRVNSRILIMRSARRGQAGPTEAAAGAVIRPADRQTCPTVAGTARPDPPTADSGG
jgi:hypothetical protein